MIQLLFDAESVEEALGQEPVRVAFAQHSDGETADWDASKLEREGTHPVVYASRGSHASQYGPGLWLGWGQDGSGLGCDITNGTPLRVDPEVRLIPATISGPDDPFAWVTFAGRWGERETWAYDGPTGPAFKRQWTEPVSWMEGLRADSIRVNSGTLLGPAPSDIFCEIVEDASSLLPLSKPYPLLVAGFVGAGLALAALALRLAWPALAATWRVYRAHWPTFAGIGAITVPVTLAAGSVQYLATTSPEFATLTAWSEDSGTLQAAMSSAALLQRMLVILVVTPAVIQAVGDIDAGDPVGVRRSLREGLAHFAWTIARGSLIVLLLTISIIGIPWAVRQGVRWSLGAQSAILAGTSGESALADSAAVARGRWWRMAATDLSLAFLGATPGVIVALLLLAVARLPIGATNVATALVYAVAQPFAVAGLTVVYLRWRRGGDGVSG